YLVEKFYPQFLQTYNDLPREIYRADMARNMYMHAFGGVYADLDLVPLQPLTKHIPMLADASHSPMKLAFVGHMSDDNFQHSIPNAFMASTTPGHPFWLKPLEFIQEHISSRAYNAHPEELTGPVALRSCVKEWEKDSLQRYADGVFDRVEVLENGKVCESFFSPEPSDVFALDISIQLVGFTVPAS
ncbi:1221_t:CDS:2, partial [Acaulospora colombiana]